MILLALQKRKSRRIPSTYIYGNPVVAQLQLAGFGHIPLSGHYYLDFTSRSNADGTRKGGEQTTQILNFSQAIDRIRNIAWGSSTAGW